MGVGSGLLSCQLAPLHQVLYQGVVPGNQHNSLGVNVVTDRGAVRQQNQDAYAARLLEDGRVIALVCDGMGGARAGTSNFSTPTLLFTGMILDRVSSSGAWRETDKVNCNPYRASLSICSTKPQVDTAWSRCLCVISTATPCASPARWAAGWV